MNPAKHTTVPLGVEVCFFRNIGNGIKVRQRGSKEEIMSIMERESEIGGRKLNSWPKPLDILAWRQYNKRR